MDQSGFADSTVLLIWKCYKCQFGYPTDRTAKRFHQDPGEIPRLHEKIHGKTIEDADAFAEYHSLTGALDLATDIDRLTPGAKVKLIKQPQVGREKLTRYLALGAELNVLRDVKFPIPSVRPGIARYLRFCDLVWRPSFPPTEDAVQLWSSTFNP